MDKAGLVSFEGGTTLLSPLLGMWQNRFLDHCCVLFFVLAYYPCVEVVDKTEGSALTIDLPLYQVCIIEDIKERRQRRALRDPGILYLPRLRLIASYYHQCISARTEVPDPSDHLFRNSPRSQTTF